MRFSIFVLCCFILIMHYQSANAGLLKDFVEKIDNTAQKVRSDVRNVFHPVNENQDDSIHFDDNNGGSKTDNVNPVPAKNVESSTQSAVTVTPTSSSNTTSTEKDGRENFDGGCATGYQRTADGRCKPTF